MVVLITAMTCELESHSLTASPGAGRSVEGGVGAALEVVVVLAGVDVAAVAEAIVGADIARVAAADDGRVATDDAARTPRLWLDDLRIVGPAVAADHVEEVGIEGERGRLDAEDGRTPAVLPDRVPLKQEVGPLPRDTSMREEENALGQGSVRSHGHDCQVQGAINDDSASASYIPSALDDEART